MNTIKIIDKLPLHLEQIAAGDFYDDEMQAFEELDLIVLQVPAANEFLRNKHLLKLYGTNATGRQSLLLFANKAIEYSTQNLACIIAEVLIKVYVEYSDSSALKMLFELVIFFRFINLVNLENEGRYIRFQESKNSFTVETRLIHPKFRTELFQLLLKKYSRILVEDGPPNQQELLSIIDRLNELFRQLDSHNYEELSRFPALIPFAVSHSIAYDPILATKIFDAEVDFSNFDNELFKKFHIPLFPIVNEDKIEITTNKVTLVNEGLGHLPYSKIRIVVGSVEFELGEQNRIVAPNAEHSLYISKDVELATFLADHDPNTDVKLVIAFRKFDHSYEYSLLSGLVGDWRSKFPVIESNAKPDFDIVFPHEVPLNGLSPREFERLCLWLVEEAKDDAGNKRFHKVLWLGEDGGGEMGRDIICIENRTGKSFVFQCKRVGKFLPNELEKELQTFNGYVKKSPAILPDEYVLFVSAAITAETKKRGDKIAKTIGMGIDYWPKSTIDRLVRGNSLVRKRFWDIVQRAE